MKKLLCICLLAFCFLNNYMQAQRPYESGKYSSEKSTSKKQSDQLFQSINKKEPSNLGISNIPIIIFEKPNTYIDTTEEKSTNDFVLYRDVVRRNTWLEGHGEPIAQKIANHLPYYYRLSKKNAAGHYQMVEALHCNALTTNHPLSTYILKKQVDTDDKNKEWRERLLTVCQWHFYSDFSGDNVIEERAKSDKNQLVYIMQVTKNDSAHVTLSYLDSWGLPADMNEDDSHIYGSVVSITYDRNGCDSIIDYLDGAGYRKSNTNGVDQERYLYDEKHRPIQITSNNCVGDYAIDNWENCGVQCIYDDINNTYSIIHIDENLQPMRMSSMRANEESTYIRCDINKDKWGRISEKIFLTANGEKDATLSGIHRIIYSYTDDGVLIEKKYYDINGNILK